jgi:HK97 family phage major capsid protein
MEFRFADEYRGGRTAGVPNDELSLERFLLGAITKRWPADSPEQRVAQISSDTGGGYVVPAGFLTALFVDEVRAAMVMSRAGASTIKMNLPTETIAQLTKSPTAYTVRELEAITESDAEFAAIKLEAKTIGSLTGISWELLHYGSNAGSILKKAMVESQAVEWDRLCLMGAGGAQPRGLKNDPDIKTKLLGADGAVLTIDDVADAWGELATANIPENTKLSFICSPKVYKNWSKLKTGDGKYLKGEDLPLFLKTTQFLKTTNISDSLKQGTSNTCSEAFYGDFRQILMGRLGGLQLKMSDDVSVENFAKRKVLIRAFEMGDVVTLRPAWLMRIYGIETE